MFVLGLTWLLAALDLLGSRVKNFEGLSKEASHKWEPTQYIFVLATGMDLSTLPLRALFELRPRYLPCHSFRYLKTLVPVM